LETEHLISFARKAFFRGVLDKLPLHGVRTRIRVHAKWKTRVEGNPFGTSEVLLRLPACVIEVVVHLILHWAGNALFPIFEHFLSAATLFLLIFQQGKSHLCSDPLPSTSSDFI
jgi:hypothetical protein